MTNSKFGDLIKQARKPENQISTQPDAPPDPDVNLSIKVKLSQRAHWASQAKLHNLTITQVIIDALNQRFGTPPSS